MLTPLHIQGYEHHGYWRDILRLNDEYYYFYNALSTSNWRHIFAARQVSFANNLPASRLSNVCYVRLLTFSRQTLLQIIIQGSMEMFQDLLRYV